MTQSPHQDAGIQAAGPFLLIVARVLAAATTLACIMWNADVPQWLGVAYLNEQYLALILGLCIAALFLRLGPDGKERLRAPWYDVALAAAGLVTLLYTSFNYVYLLNLVGDRPVILTVIGGIVVVLVLEGLRRATGWVLFSLVLVFIAYALVGHLAPGDFVGRRIAFSHLLQYIGFDPSAVFGTALNVGASVVILFVFMGQLLFKAGGGAFFTDLAQAATGRTRGGSAKIAVVASALFGSISGSAVSNVATTGVITIPMMRRSGYSAVNAGAIEAIASTGGQLMPPIMGAAAFLMAEFLETPYATIMVAALLPSALYYLAAFFQVDLLAARHNIRNVDADLPRMSQVMRQGWHFMLPFVVLLYALFGLGEDPEKAALYAALSVAVVGLLRPYKGERLTPGDLVAVLWQTGFAVMELILIVAAAGFVIGILNISGLGFALTLFLVKIAGHQIIIILVLAALICIVLGMGMPTSGVYVLLAALVAPSIIEAGADPLAAHMFILYFGMMSMITPPIALAAFAAATLSRAGAMETGFAAMRLGWVAYVVPFLFIMSPTLLFKGDALVIAWDFFTALMGVYLVTVAIVGWFGAVLGVPLRIALAAAGLLAMLGHGLIPYSGPVSAGAVLGGLACLGFLFQRARLARRVADG